MRIQWNEDKIAALRQRLDDLDDAQSTGPDEYVADLYDLDPPMTMELALEQGAVHVLAAEIMAFDQEMDGWYLAGRADDGAVRAALEGLL